MRALQLFGPIPLMDELMSQNTPTTRFRGVLILIIAWTILSACPTKRQKHYPQLEFPIFWQGYFGHSWHCISFIIICCFTSMEQ